MDSRRLRTDNLLGGASSGLSVESDLASELDVGVSGWARINVGDRMSASERPVLLGVDRESRCERSGASFFTPAGARLDPQKRVSKSSI
ncbi:MAG: hypothetical protein ABIR33_09665 [Pyrinomonadaceae bacterium]